MIVLGIETSTPVCSVGLTNNQKLVAEFSLNIRNAHSRVLAGAVKNILDSAAIEISDLDGIAISIGPGSFTGLRIGLSLVKGLALNSDMKCAAVPTLAALASQAPVSDGLVYPFLKSRAKEYFVAGYKRINFADSLVQDVILKKADKLEGFIPENAWLVGRQEDLVLENPLKNVNLVPDFYSHLSGYTIARLGTQQILAGRTEDIHTLEPSYYQDFIAGKPKKFLILREMTTGDLEYVCELEKKYFKTPWSENAFLAEFNASYSNSYILEADNKIIGYAVAWFLVDEFHLANIAIDDKFRNQGFGFRFVNELLQFARQKNCKYAFLEVRASNIPAIKLYKKLGFTVAGIRKNYYQAENEDALLMSNFLF